DLLRAKRTSGAPAAQGGEPADRIEIAGSAVERESDEFGAPADILPRHRTAQTLARQREAAVGAVIAIVAHQEDMAFGDRDAGEIVRVRMIADIDDIIEAAIGEIFPKDGQTAIEVPILAAYPEIAERLRVA